MAPYTGAIKYDYQSLPFFCLLVGSLLGKCHTLFATLNKKLKESWLFFGIACLGVFTIAATIFTNFYNINIYSQLNVVKFSVEGQVGYSFSNSSQIIQPNSLLSLQYVGFAVFLSGLIWAAKNEIIKNSQTFG
jgi:hypothetical protein